jgi:hypothetical protein
MCVCDVRVTCASQERLAEQCHRWHFSLPSIEAKIEHAFVYVWLWLWLFTRHAHHIRRTNFLNLFLLILFGLKLLIQTTSSGDHSEGA